MATFRTELKKTVNTGVELLGDYVERQLRFTAKLVDGGIDNVKQLRTCKTAGEVLNTELAYFNGLREEIKTFGTENAAIAKKFGNNAAKLVKRKQA